MRAFLFPGQGSQKVGMGKELATAYASAREVFEAVDEALDESLSKLMWEGPQDELVMTRNAQPALMAVSIAAMEVLRREGGFDVSEQVSFVAGHSLGEYSALCSVGVFSLGDTARLLRLRGEAMQRAVPIGEGSMAAVLGMKAEQVAEVAAAAAENEVCVVANDNAPGQVVVSGHANAVSRAMSIAKRRGAKRSIPLSVSAPFHCPLMSPAAEEMREALSNVEAASPMLPVVGNVTAFPMDSHTEILSLLVKQIVSMVRWRESMNYLASVGVENVTEVGAGSVLAGLARRCSPGFTATALGTPDEIENFLGSL